MLPRDSRSWSERETGAPEDTDESHRSVLECLAQ